MTIHITDPETEALVRRLAASTGKDPIEAIRAAMAEKIERDPPKEIDWDRIRQLEDEFRKAPKTGLTADKAFFDELSGEP